MIHNDKKEKEIALVVTCVHFFQVSLIIRIYLHNYVDVD